MIYTFHSHTAALIPHSLSRLQGQTTSESCPPNTPVNERPAHGVMSQWVPFDALASRCAVCGYPSPGARPARRHVRHPQHVPLRRVPPPSPEHAWQPAPPQRLRVCQSVCNSLSLGSLSARPAAAAVLLWPARRWRGEGWFPVQQGVELCLEGLTDRGRDGHEFLRELEERVAQAGAETCPGEECAHTVGRAVKAIRQDAPDPIRGLLLGRGTLKHRRIGSRLPHWPPRYSPGAR